MYSFVGIILAPQVEPLAQPDIKETARHHILKTNKGLIKICKDHVPCTVRGENNASAKSN